MELSSIIGPVLGAIAVVGTAVLKGLSVGMLWGGSAAMIVGLGAFAAVLTAYPMKDVTFSFKSLGLFLNGPKLDAEGTISTIERLAQLARKDGVLALEKEIDKLDDDLMKKGIEMVSMNTEAVVIENTLYAEIDLMYEEEEIAAKFWEDMGAFAPTIGILGAVLGLMVVMLNLDNPPEIGPGIKTAFIATLYGVALANLFALPCGKKIKRMCHHKKVYREMIATGVIGISQGTAPKVLVERLHGMAH
ncbi:MAG: motility protein A [Spirobacillus cienkowskii]|jgi:chemotaxis protein MotA|uniref:Motility protein A n=1 Tax=Spirobacillus cienkowskii TaxID=495820 RepID=A0A369KL20_9BACT|nr:MAG: motility protein A [Spirobacillus cienkowskii]